MSPAPALTRAPRLTPSCVSGTQVLRFLLPRGVHRGTERPHPANRKAGGPHHCPRVSRSRLLVLQAALFPKVCAISTGQNHKSPSRRAPSLAAEGAPAPRLGSGGELPPARGLSICTRPAAGECPAVGLRTAGADAHGAAASSTCPTARHPVSAGAQGTAAHTRLSMVRLDLVPV